MGNWTRDLLTCRAVPQPTVPSRAPHVSTHRALNESVNPIIRMGTLFTLVCIWKFGAVIGVLHPCVICHNILVKGLLKLYRKTTQNETTFTVEWPIKQNSHLVKDLWYRLLIAGKFHHRKNIGNVRVQLLATVFMKSAGQGRFGRLWVLTSECDAHWRVYSEQQN